MACMGGFETNACHLQLCALAQPVSQGIGGIRATRVKVEGLNLREGICQNRHGAVEHLTAHLQWLGGHGMLGS